MLVIKRLFKGVNVSDLEMDASISRIGLSTKLTLSNDPYRSMGKKVAIGGMETTAFPPYIPTPPGTNRQTAPIPGTLHDGEVLSHSINIVKSADMPTYSIELTLLDSGKSKLSVPEVLNSLDQLRRPVMPTKNSAPEAASAPVAIFQRSKFGEQTEDKLLCAGIIKEFSYSYLLDQSRIKGASVKMSILDCRLENDFLKHVNLDLLGGSKESANQGKVRAGQSSGARSKD